MSGDVWRKSYLEPIYKNKGDVQKCRNYRGIKLTSRSMEVWKCNGENIKGKNNCVKKSVSDLYQESQQ